MSNELVPYQQLERMSTAVAKSGLFGVKSQDQALALMLLAQSENIHPMTAVRDYDIVQGRPSMKAEAMLSRFLESGGKVQWHALQDEIADATFTSRDGSSARIDWTIERAKRAGLAGKDVWKAYPRSMLRSRCISEGIRTVAPYVTRGKYTPEEAMHIETVEPSLTVEQRIETIGNRMLLAQRTEHSVEIKNAQDMDQLKIAFGNAWNAAKAIGDEDTQESFRRIYGERKAELERPVIEGNTTEEQI